ncbi:hypothetical protein MRS44_013189 [Fusarium solani]|uniref:uncharacterized protein n=1 Tax=Fusarium solani TaxID=169388 RepID=UPI0032C4095A|nr:hypothetical protein MRS44_013189 [Fusarium solani]
MIFVGHRLFTHSSLNEADDSILDTNSHDRDKAFVMAEHFESEFPRFIPVSSAPDLPGDAIDDTNSTLNDINWALDLDPSCLVAEAHASSEMFSVELDTPSWARNQGHDATTQILSQNNEDQDSSLPGRLFGSKERASDHPNSSTPANDMSTAPKIGKRFSSGSVRVLNNWLLSHIHRPYPSVGDVERLEKLSGLNKQQILNWFANARRRKKFPLCQVPASDPQLPETPPLEITRGRPATPVPEHMNPFERWRNSPPENEPANVAAIARAVSGLPLGEMAGTHSADGGPSRSPDNAYSITSTGTSDSSRSSRTSAYSYTSKASQNSIGYLRKARKRRKRPNAGVERSRSGALFQICHRFQCTFCTETFKTKHNWQRHEKSLHLSLEQWQCSPNGPTSKNADQVDECVYCGIVNPDSGHLDNHNHASCLERQSEERTFYRKDHLIQHLRLMHGARFRKWPMGEWKVTSGEILSRCGFCNLDMDTWAERGDHLAEHFKEGKTMADWKGDWGFEPHVLEMVENSVPPYLIHYERNSPLPFTTQQGAPNSPSSAFELIQLELDYFSTNQIEAGHSAPSNKLLQYEACCIIFGAEIIFRHDSAPTPSWLRDLLLSSEKITRDARLRPMKNAAKSRYTQLKIHGKRDIFEDCKLESLLRQHVDMLQLLNFEIGNDELQLEACNIVNQMPNSSPMFVKLLCDLAYDSSHWLEPFRLRARLSPTTTASHTAPNHSPTQHTFTTNTTLDLPLPGVPGEGGSWMGGRNKSAALYTTSFVTGGFGTVAGPKATKVVLLNDSNMYRALTRELSRFVASAISPLNPNNHAPTDEELQYQARWIMYDDGDPWNQTPADNPDWLREFKRDIGL